MTDHEKMGNLFDALARTASRDVGAAEETLREAGYDPEEVRKRGLAFIEGLRNKARSARPGDVLHIKNDAGGNDWHWYIHAFCSGATGQESVVVVSSADGRKPAEGLEAGGHETREVKHIPTVMIERLVESGAAKVINGFEEYDHPIQL